MRGRHRRDPRRRGGPPAQPRRATRRQPRRRSERRVPTAPAAATPIGLDGGVVASTALLAALGVVMIYSTTAPLAIGSAIPPHFVRHLAGLVLALLAIVGALRVPLGWWRRLALPLWAASVALLAATLALGIEANGARRWLPVPLLGVSFQPAELAKWATSLAVAAVLAGGRPESRRLLLICLALGALPAGLLLLQPDLGNAVVLAVLVGALLFVAGVPLRRLTGLGALLGVGVATYIGLRPYALDRLRGFLAPWQNAQAEGFQLVQSFVAFGRGGTFGVGLGDGRQKLSYLPEAHTDFILSVVAEEVGLVGVLLVLGAFAALVVAGLRVARRAREPFVVLVAFAMTALVAVPAAVNAGVVMGVLPTTGFVLPFLSVGSNSLVMCALAVGILLRIASHEASPARPRLASAATRRRRSR
jgi:cell division protein FtsW